MLFVTLVCHCPSESHKADCKVQNKKIFITTECLKIRTPVFLFIYLFLNTLIEKFQKVQIKYKDQFQQ